MKKRFEGHLAPHGLYILDTYSGEVKFIPHGTEILNNVNELVNHEAMNNSLPHKFRQNLTSFENEIISTYPYPVAKPYSELIAETDPRQKCKLMVDTFTAVLKLMALQVASEYIRAKEVKDLRVNQTLKHDIQRPLISDWNNVLKETIPVLVQHNVPFFSPELVRAYENLESKCQDKVMVEKHYEEDNGQLVAKRSPLAKIQALIKYRNSLAHGFNQSRERAAKELETYLPVLKDILQEVRYMSRYTLWHVASKEDNVEGIRLMGCHPNKQMLQIDRSLLDPGVSPLFLVNESTLEVLPMFSFLDIDISEGSNIAETGKDIFIFDGNTNSTVIYLSTASGQHLEKKSRMKHWKELLRNKEMELKMISDKDLDIQKLFTMSSLTTGQTIQTLINSGKFIPEVTLKRDDLERYLDQFLLGDFGAILIGGESGIGKSTLLADKVSDWSEKGNPVMFYKASSFNTPEIGQKFIRDMGIKVHFPEEFFALVNDTMSSSGKYFYLVIDAVNEYNGDVNMLINAIESLVAQGASYRWFRVIITVRDSSYNRAHARFGSRVQERYLSVEIDQAGEKVRTMIIPLRRLTENTVGQIYEKYRSYLVKDTEDETDPGYHIFKPNTAFADLDPNGSTVEQMKSPLMMRLILQAFNRKDLPSNLSTDSAMQIYLDEVITEVHNPNGSFSARKNFLNALVRTLDRLGSDTIRRDDVLTNTSLREAIMNPQKDSPYVQLLDLGVLMEEWEEGECYVRFSFDRLFEFLLADEHFKRDITVDYLRDLIGRSKVFKSMEGALQVIMTRLVLNGRRAVIIELIDGVDPEEERSIQLIVGFLKTLFYLDRKEFTQLTETLPENPSTSDLCILSELLKSDLVFSTTETERLLEIMLEIAQVLNDLKYQADVLCLTGNHLMKIGEPKLALIRFTEAKELYELLNDMDGTARALNLIARAQLETNLYFWEFPELDFETLSEKVTVPIETEILTYLESKEDSWYSNLMKASELNEKLDSTQSRERLIDNLVNIAYGINQTLEMWFPELAIGLEDIDDESFQKIKLDKEKIIDQLYLKAIEIGKDLPDKTGVIIAYNNLASSSIFFSDFINSKKYLQKALKISEESGLINSLGYIYWNLGVCEASINHDFSSFLELSLKAVDYSKRSGDLQGEIDLLRQLLFALDSGDLPLNESQKEYYNQLMIEAAFDLFKRWVFALSSSSIKNGVRLDDLYSIGRMLENLIEIPWVNLKQVRKRILESDPNVQWILISHLFESKRLSVRLDFDKTDFDFMIILSELKLDEVNSFLHDDDKIQIEKFNETIENYLKGKQSIESLYNDDWFTLYTIMKLFTENELETKNDRVNIERILSYIMWCQTQKEFNAEMEKHGATVRNYLKALRKDKDKSIKSQFPPIAILILEKLINGKNPSEKEIIECVNTFDMLYVHEFPIAFFYRLIIYLYKKKDHETLKTVFKKLDEESIKWTEVWPRSEEVLRIQKEVNTKRK